MHEFLFYVNAEKITTLFVFKEDSKKRRSDRG